MTQFNSWLVGKQCPFTKDLTMAIMKMQELGFYKHYKRKAYQIEKGTVIKLGERFASRLSITITLPNFLKISSVLGFGYLCGLTALLLELSLSKFLYN